MIGAISPQSAPIFGGSASAPGASNASAAAAPAGVTTPQDIVSISVCPVCGQEGHTAGFHDDDGKLGAPADASKADKSTQPGEATAPNGKPLSDEQQQEVAKLKEIDRSVHAHERAHAAAGGHLAGSPSYEYTTGPDGHQYAVGGEVPISVPSGGGGNPQQTIQQLQQVIAAALAPADPSGQDRAVAAEARAEMAKAQAELLKKSTAQLDKALGKDDAPDAKPGDKDAADAAPKIVGPKPAKDHTADQTEAEPSIPVVGPQPRPHDAPTPDASSVDKPAAPKIVGPQPFGSRRGNDDRDPASSDDGPERRGRAEPATPAPVLAYQRVNRGRGPEASRSTVSISA